MSPPGFPGPSSGPSTFAGMIFACTGRRRCEHPISNHPHGVFCCSHPPRCFPRSPNAWIWARTAVFRGRSMCSSEAIHDEWPEDLDSSSHKVRGADSEVVGVPRTSHPQPLDGTSHTTQLATCDCWLFCFVLFESTEHLSSSMGRWVVCGLWTFRGVSPEPSRVWEISP